ncbi:MAG: Gfo/Idh/MocA family oxidoreductase [Patescibacteria group bacterium]|mgnify:CR=1 FL=1
MSALFGRTAAVLGLGRMGQNHLESYRMGGARVIAASDIRPETQEPFESAHPEARWYEDWRELLAKETPDLLSIVTNGPSHAEMVIAAAQASIPVIMCEKPMATSIEEAEAMLDACKKSGSRLYINFTLRAFPAFQQLIRYASDGTIGEVRLVSVFIGGARGLGCVGSHYVDMMRLLIKSEPVSIHGRLDRTGTPNPRGEQFRDPGGVAVYEFENGARGILEMFEDYSLPPYLVVVGTKGRITADIAQNRWQLEVYADKEWSYPSFLVDTPPTLAEGTLAMIVDAAHDGTMAATGPDGLTALHMILGIHAADSADRSISLPLQADEKKIIVPMT